MTEVDFSECSFINDVMSFYTYNDFCNVCGGIKRLYGQLSTNAKLFYKWYVYANTHMDLYYKNAIWDYLNSSSPEFYERLMKLRKRYKVK